MTMEDTIKENNSMLSSPRTIKNNTFELSPSEASRRNLRIKYRPDGQILEIERADAPELIRSLKAAYDIP